MELIGRRQDNYEYFGYKQKAQSFRPNKNERTN